MGAAKLSCLLGVLRETDAAAWCLHKSIQDQCGLAGAREIRKWFFFFPSVLSSLKG